MVRNIADIIYYLPNLIKVISKNKIFYGINKSLCNVQIQLKLPPL